MALVLHASTKRRQEDEVWNRGDHNESVEDAPSREAVNNVQGTDDSVTRERPNLYPSAPLAADEIRLLEILPGDEADAIKCALRTASFSDNLGYDAVSYTWGGSAEGRTITLETLADFPVTDNAYSALTRFRQPEKTKVIWIDAICINQQDLAERERQVSVMGQIYRQASCVLVWLGDHGTNAAPGFSGPDAEMQGAMDAILWKRPRWWKRAWVVQEVAHAQTVHVYFGKFGKPWPDFCWELFGLAAGERSNFTTFRECVEWSRSQKWSRTVLHQQVVERFSMINSVRSERRWAAEGRSTAPTLLQLADWTRAQDCKDVRDKVYSVVSLLPSSEAALIHIDYQKSTSWWMVYCRATLASIVAQRSLNIMQLCRFDYTFGLSTPTWMVGIGQLPSVDGNFSSFFFDEYQVHWPNQQREWTNAVSLSYNARTLTLPGAHFDTVFAVDTQGGNFFDSPARSDAEMKYGSGRNTVAPESLSTLLEGALVRVSNQDAYASIGARTTASRDPSEVRSLQDLPTSIRTTARSIRKTKLSGRPASVLDAIVAAFQCWEVLAGLKDHMPYLTDDVDCQLDMARAWAYASAANYGVNVFVTSAGFIGIGCGTVSKGDRVVLLHGATHPVVLRACPDMYPAESSWCSEHHPVAEHYKFRGFAYVHGTTHGELLRMCRAEDFLEQTFQLV